MDRELAEKIAYDLLGTCRSLADIALNYHNVEIDDLSHEEEDLLHDVVDNITFECIECGWFQEAGYWNTDDTDNGNICLDCRPMED
jgi:hypothetical protein